MASTEKRTSDARDTTPDVLRPEPTGTKKTKPTRAKIPKSTAARTTARSVKMLANGLVDLTEPPRQILDIAKRNAAMSPLLRLPAEIRNTIWKLAVGGHRVDPPKGTQLKGGAFEAETTVQPTIPPDGLGDVAGTDLARYLQQSNAMLAEYQRPYASDHATALQDMKDMRRTATAFHLPEVSRQIYAETATLGYAFNVLKLDREDSEWIDSLTPAQRNAIHSVEPSTYFSSDMYSGRVVSEANRSLISSLRRRFKNLNKVYLAKDTVEQMMFARDIGSGWTMETSRNQVVALIKKKEGDDVEVILE